MNVRDTLKSLTQEQRDAIMDKFNKVEQGIVELPEGKFIGVHIDDFSNLIVDETLGAWCVGHLEHPS
jgi:hypothetical protein